MSQKTEHIAIAGKTTYTCDVCGTSLVLEHDGSRNMVVENVPEGFINVSFGVPDERARFADVCGDCTGLTFAEVLSVARDFHEAFGPFGVSDAA